MIKAVIFDLDGTVINTLEGLAYACNLSLEKMHISPIPVNTYKTLIGCGADKLMVDMLITQNCPTDSETVAKLKGYFNQFYKENLLYKAHPYDGIKEMLADLKKLGLKLGIFSNKPDVYTQLMVSALLPETFNVVYGKKDHLPRKPDPTGAFAVAKELGIFPEECLYVGDSGVDMLTANSAKMIPMGVLWGFRDSKELLDNGARFLASTPSDITNVIQSEFAKNTQA